MGLIGFSTLEYSFPPPGSPELDFSECVGVYSLLLDPLFLERFGDFRGEGEGSPSASLCFVAFWPEMIQTHVQVHIFWTNKKKVYVFS